MKLQIRDPLQKKLKEMEQRNASPSLEDVKPTLKERIYFVKRGLSGDVGTVSRSESITQKYLSDPNERVKYEVHKGMVRAELFQDFSSAGYVLRGHIVETTIDGKQREFLIAGNTFVADTILSEYDPDSFLLSKTGAKCAMAYFLKGEPIGLHAIYYSGSIYGPGRKSQILSGDPILAARCYAKSAKEVIGHLEEKLGRTLINEDMKGGNKNVR